jgi:hypothetical protein
MFTIAETEFEFNAPVAVGNDYEVAAPLFFAVKG